jgi:hypothetical protein
MIILFLMNGAYRSDHEMENRVVHFNHDPRNYGIEYYDPISFYKGNPRIGLESIPFAYNGIIYVFSSTDNKKEFVEKARDLEPRFGGWCAYSMTKGKKVNFEPSAFSIYNDSLYLFKDIESKDMFIKDYENMNNKAWQNWSKILPTFNPKDSVFRYKN